MKKIFYLFLILSLAFGLQSCGGSGGSADDPEPGPEPGATKVSFALKSDINGVQDNDLKTALTHLRLYLYDKDQKLVSVNKYTSADALKAIDWKKEIIPLCWSGMFQKTGIFPPKQSVRHFPACLYN